MTHRRLTTASILALVVACAIQARAAELVSVEDALAEAFPTPLTVTSSWATLSSNEVERVAESTGLDRPKSVFKYYIAAADGVVVGYAIVDRVKGKYGQIRYMVVFDEGPTVRSVRILALREQRGRAAAKPAFLGQFKGKSPSDPVRINADVDAITGATITSRAVAMGVRKSLLYMSLVNTDSE